MSAELGFPYLRSFLRLMNDEDVIGIRYNRESLRAARREEFYDQFAVRHSE